MGALVHFFALLSAVSNTVLSLSVFGVELKFIFVGLIIFDILVHFLIFTSKTSGSFSRGRPSHGNSSSSLSDSKS